MQPNLCLRCNQTHAYWNKIELFGICFWVEIQIQWSEESNKIESKAQMQHSWGIPNISLINRAVKKPSNASDVCFVVCNFDEPQ